MTERATGYHDLGRRKDTPVAARRLKERAKREAKRVKRAQAKERTMHWMRRYRELLPNSDKLLERDKLIAEAAQEEVARRLNEAPQNLTDHALIRFKDSAVNTISRKEQWDKRKDADPKEALAQMAKRLAELNGTLKLELSFDSDPIDEFETIDVTPTYPQED